MISVDVEFVGTQTGDTEYRVTATAQSATEMPTEIFLFNAATLEFTNVCIVKDLVWNTTPAPGDAYYRSSTVQLVYPNLTRALSARATLQARIQDLVDQLKADVPAFLTTAVVTFE